VLLTGGVVKNVIKGLKDEQELATVRHRRIGLNANDDVTPEAGKVGHLGPKNIIGGKNGPGELQGRELSERDVRLIPVEIVNDVGLGEKINHVLSRNDEVGRAIKSGGLGIRLRGCSDSSAGINEYSGVLCLLEDGDLSNDRNSVCARMLWIGAHIGRSS
jgi:hypothetical protein